MGDRTLRRPLLWVGAAWAGGILLAYSLPVSPGIVGVASLILVLTAGWQAWREWSGELRRGAVAGAKAGGMAFLLLLGVVLGGAAAWSADREQLATWPLLQYRSFGAERGGSVLLEGVVLSCRHRPPDKREGWEVVFQPERWQPHPLSGPLAGERTWQEVLPRASVLLYVFAHSDRSGEEVIAVDTSTNNRATPIHSDDRDFLLPGDRIRVPVELRRPDGDGNPGEFSFAAYLARRRILAVAYADFSDVKVLAASRAAGLRLAVSRYLTLARRWFLQHATCNLPEPYSALAAGVVLGEKEAMTEVIEEAFRRSGLSHLLSVSGFHVGLLAGVLYSLGQLLRLSSGACRLLLLAGIAGYVGLSGATPAATRAGLMVSLFTLLGSNKSLDRINVLAAAGLIMLMRDPFLLHDLGFQLSFAATAGLLLWSGRLWSVLAKWHRWLAGQLGATVAVTLVAQLSTLPITWSIFAEVAVWGLLANTLVTPVMGMVLPLAAIHAVCAALPGPGWLESISRLLLFLPLRYSWVILETVGKLPAGLVRLPPLSPWQILTLVVLAGRLVVRSPGGFRSPFHHLRPGRPPAAVVVRGVVLLLLICSLGGSVARIRDERRVLHVYFFDVGQGDAALLLPPGGSGVLVDTGPAYAGQRLVSAVQRVTGSNELEAIFLSHAHEDHVGGLPAVLAGLKAKKVWYGPELGAKLEVQLAGVPAAQLEAGDWQRMPGGLTVEVLWPGKDAPVWSENNRSLVLLFTYGRVGLLFPGDLESSGQRALYASNPGRQLRSRGEADLLRVLKVPHHGGRTAWWEPFCRQVWPPDVAVISVGRNSFGHPDREVTASLAAVGLVLRTDLLGAVHLITDGQRLVVEGWVRDEVGLRRPHRLCLWDSERAA